MTRKGDVNYVEAFSLVVIFINDRKDLAFFLMTHNFDAYPKEYYVEVHIEDTIYKLVPNGNQPGLASLNESHGLI